MVVRTLVSDWTARLALAGALLVPLAAVPTAAMAVDQGAVRVVSCEPGSLRADLQATPVAPVADSEDESVPEQQQPALHGSIALPGVNEDDSKAIAAAIAAQGLTTIAPVAATDAARNALADGSLRSFRRPELQLENEQAVWAIETKLNDRTSSVNPALEVKVDAGNSTILSVECD